MRFKIGDEYFDERTFKKYLNEAIRVEFFNSLDEHTSKYITLGIKYWHSGIYAKALNSFAEEKKNELDENGTVEIDGVIFTKEGKEKDNEDSEENEERETSV